MTQTKAITSLLDWTREKPGRSWEIRSSPEGIKIVFVEGWMRGERVVLDEAFLFAEDDVLDWAVAECVGMIARMANPQAGEK